MAGPLLQQGAQGGSRFEEVNVGHAVFECLGGANSRIRENLRRRKKEIVTSLGLKRGGWLGSSQKQDGLCRGDEDLSGEGSFPHASAVPRDREGTSHVTSLNLRASAVRTGPLMSADSLAQQRRGGRCLGFSLDPEALMTMWRAEWAQPAW